MNDGHFCKTLHRLNYRHLQSSIVKSFTINLLELITDMSLEVRYVKYEFSIVHK